LRKPVGEGASLRLDAGRRMEQREKRSQVDTGGQIREEAVPPKRP